MLKLEMFTRAEHHRLDDRVHLHLVSDGITFELPSCLPVHLHLFKWMARASSAVLVHVATTNVGLIFSFALCLRETGCDLCIITAPGPVMRLAGVHRTCVSGHCMQ